MHKHAPLKVFSTRDDRQPWVNTEFFESANERDELAKKAEKSNRACDAFIAKRARNRTVSLKRELKRLFFQTSIRDSHGTQQNYGKPSRDYCKTQLRKTPSTA